MPYTITKLEKIDDNSSSDHSSTNFGKGGMSVTFYTPRGTFFFQWKGVIGEQNGCYLDGKHIADIYEEYSRKQK